MAKCGVREFKKQFTPRPNLNVPAGLWRASSKIELEIGAGDGEFAFQRAKSAPDTQFIAIEKTRTLFHKMLCRQNQTPNLWIFHTNAVWWISHFAEKQSLDKVYILYPNVYVKARQHHLRWFNRPFMPYLLTRLKKHGRLEIRTNEKSYYEECKQKMKNFSQVQNIKDLCLSPPPRTAFERKYMKRGQVCRLLLYTKNPKG